MLSYKGGAVAEWSKALLVRETKRKSKRSQVCPPTWAPLKKMLSYNVSTPTEEFDLKLSIDEPNELALEL